MWKWCHHTNSPPNCFDSKKPQPYNFFFRVEGDYTYCKICEINFANTNKKVHGYKRLSGNTSNLISHLRDKHHITKDNYLEYLDEHKEVFNLLLNHVTMSYIELWNFMDYFKLFNSHILNPQILIPQHHVLLNDKN
jgi:hypothetical protein